MGRKKQENARSEAAENMFNGNKKYKFSKEVEDDEVGIYLNLRTDFRRCRNIRSSAIIINDNNGNYENKQGFLDPTGYRFGFYSEL